MAVVSNTMRNMIVVNFLLSDYPWFCIVIEVILFMFEDLPYISKNEKTQTQTQKQTKNTQTGTRTKRIWFWEKLFLGVQSILSIVEFKCALRTIVYQSNILLLRWVGLNHRQYMQSHEKPLKQTYIYTNDSSNS